MSQIQWKQTRSWVTTAGGLALALGLAVIATPGAPAAERSARVRAVRAVEGDAGRTTVTITASEKPTFTTWKLERPSRVVVDVSGATLGEVDVPFDAGTYALGAVSASGGNDEGGPHTRVVLTLRQASDYQVRSVGSDIIVDLVPQSPPPPKGTGGAEAALAVKKAEEARKQAEAARAAAESESRRLIEERRKAEDAQKATESLAKQLADERLALDRSRKEVTDARKAVTEAQAREAQKAADAAGRRLADENAQLESRRSRAEEAQKAADAASRKLAEEKAELETRRLRAEEAQRAADAAARALAAEKGRTAADRSKADEARQAAESTARKLTEEKRELESRRVRAEEAQRAADAAARRLASENAQLESRRVRAEEAQRAADVLARRIAAERVDLDERKLRADESRKQAEAARALAEQAGAAARKAEERAQAVVAEALAAQKRAEERAAKASRAESEMARKELLAARAETDKARLAADRAAAELARLGREKKELESVVAEVAVAQKRAEERVAEARRAEAELGRRSAETAQREEAVEARRRTLEAKEAEIAAQRRRLDEAGKVVAEREAAAVRTASELAAREKAVEEARRKAQEAAARADATAEERARALRAVAEAEAQRKDALGAVEKSRGILEEATRARRQEETRRAELERERLGEEEKLRKAVADRSAEEARKVEAEKQRKAEEVKLADAQKNRAKVEADRAALEKEVQRLRGELAAGGKAKEAAARPVPVLAGTGGTGASARGGAGGSPAPAAFVSAPRPVAEAPRPEVKAAPVAAPATDRPRSVTLRVPSRIQRVDFVDEPVRSSVVIDLDEPALFTVERVTARRLTLRLQHADLPRALERSLDATEYFGPVRVINTYRDPAARGGVRVDVELAEDVPSHVRQDGARLYWDFQKVGPGSAAHFEVESAAVTPTRVALFRTNPLPLLYAQVQGTSQRPPASKKRYTGRRIDLDFKGADIHNILRLLSDVGGVNIVTSDDVKGEVTIKMRDVPWDQALDVVLRAKMLGQVREGNLIRVAPLQVLEKELEQEIARQKQITDVLPTETRLIGVSYAEAKDIQDRAKDLLSARGKISVDDRTNNLIVSDVGKNLALVEELVKNLDTQTSQVVIESRIVEARSTFSRAFGVQWGGSGYADAAHGNPTGLVFPSNVGDGGGASDSQSPSAGLVPRPASGVPGSAQDPNFAVNLPAAVGAGSGGALGLTLGSIAGAFNLNLRLSAFENSGQVRILSSPRIATMDNVEASIEQGVSIPISVVSAQGVQTVFVDAKLNLTVKPHVTNEGTIILQLKVTRNEPDFVNTGARGDPTILKKEAKTVMLVKDGDTAVIGGIYTRNSGLNFAKVPFFADVPILGVLFRNRKENDDRAEFLVFITPRIANRARAVGLQ